MDHLSSLWHQLNDPARVGGAIEQFPVTAGLIALLLAGALLLTGGKSHVIRFTAVAVLALGAAAAAFPLPAVAEDQPAWSAHLGWVVLALPALLLILSAAPSLPVRLPALLLALGVLVAGSGVVGYGQARWAADTADPAPQTDTPPAQADEETGTGAGAGTDADQPGDSSEDSNNPPNDESIFDFAR